MMSASTERIVLQIIELETKMQEEKLAGKDTTLLEEQIFSLRHQLNNLSEALNAPNFVLKG